MFELEAVVLLESKTMTTATKATNTPLSPAQAVKHMRKVLAITQEELGVALGISEKAVQSYEQGWRKTPPRVVKQLLTLVAMNRKDDLQRKPCWEVRSCPPEIAEPCLSNKITQGYYCWAVAAKVCAMARGDPNASALGCLKCDVVHQFLKTT